MLDTSYNVKFGDFGLARLMDHELGSHTTGLAGTFGYMAPEYVMTGRASKESDIYSSTRKHRALEESCGESMEDNTLCRLWTRNSVRISIGKKLSVLLLWGVVTSQ